MNKEVVIQIVYLLFLVMEKLPAVMINLNLVPLGEYIPFENILGGIIQRLSPLEAHQVPGKANQIFDTPFGRVIVGICYESAFAENFRYQASMGGKFILSSSNDAHYTAAMAVNIMPRISCGQLKPIDGL